jgi:ADP-heptose:LPS heptosyltransferase
MSGLPVRKVLLVTLSNLGDVILTLPVLDTLAAWYPDARITVMVGPRPKEVFEGNRRVDELIIYDKHAPFGVKAALFFALSRERFDAVIDLKNSFFGAFLPARFRTSPLLRIPAGIRHMKERNLYRLYKAMRREAESIRHERTFIFSPEDAQAMDEALFGRGVLTGAPFVVVNPSTAGAARRWPNAVWLS